ncbi:hypothetical protein [Rufibacter quisquiliarum]|uniref:Uncharacterized protein n=1 Tax=Rufibacter quisquiliarum TaxID=1549639 RepID=A0A839GHF6_9BACT|nr:hypothetical protein [Rufibacter quisquiliarum]MBA9078312.1 hypothetical protein [Rufibacter quisquiliarum]
MPETCTLPSSLTAITLSDCELKLDQIVTFLVQRGQPSNPATPIFGTEAAFKALATWTPLLAATDDTKVVKTPEFSGLVIPSSEGQFEGGGDNSTIDGIAIYKGEGPVDVTGGMFRNLTSTTRQDLLKLVNEPNLTVYMVNRHGNIFAKSDYNGIPIKNFRLGSTGSEGYNEDNKTPFSFSLQEGWDNDLIMVKADFNPRYDL